MVDRMGGTGRIFATAAQPWLTWTPAGGSLQRHQGKVSREDVTSSSETHEFSRQSHAFVRGGALCETAQEGYAGRWSVLITVAVIRFADVDLSREESNKGAPLVFSEG